MAIGMIGRPGGKGTLEDRSIIIEMRRKKRGEFVQRVTLRQLKGDLLPLRQRCLKWATEHLPTLLATESEVTAPDALTDRDRDHWAILFAIADAAGGDWPRLARDAAVELCPKETDSASIATTLLADTHQILRDAGDRISSEDLVHRLAAIEASPWGEWKRGRPITKTATARLLKRFGIAPRGIRLPDGSTPRGYLTADFEDAFERYLPSHPLDSTATPQQESDGNGLGESSCAT